MNNLKKLSNGDLQQRAANVHLTAYTCSGRQKAIRNEIELNRILDEMNARGIVVDEDVVGIFNGKGTS